MAKSTEKKETPINNKETRGEIKKKFKNFHFPALNRNIRAENLEEAIKKVSKK